MRARVQADPDVSQTLLPIVVHHHDAALADPLAVLLEGERRQQRVERVPEELAPSLDDDLAVAGIPIGQGSEDPAPGQVEGAQPLDGFEVVVGRPGRVAEEDVRARRGGGLPREGLEVGVVELVVGPAKVREALPHDVEVVGDRCREGIDPPDGAVHEPLGEEADGSAATRPAVELQPLRQACGLRAEEATGRVGAAAVVVHSPPAPDGERPRGSSHDRHGRRKGQHVGDDDVR